MEPHATKERTLSRGESRVVLDLEWREKRSVTLAELRSLCGGSDTRTRQLAHQLVRKGWLERLRPGLFRLIPASRGREGVADTNPLAAGALLIQPYFFSFGTACTHHGLTEQSFAQVYVACQRPRKPETIRGTRYVFAEVRPERFFGFEEKVILGETVNMATLERALLDALDRPDYAGGLSEVSRIVSRASGRLSWDSLLAGLRRWDESALVQRLGYLLEVHQAQLPSKRLGALRSLVRPHSKVHLGPRAKWGTTGKLNGAWNIIENVPLETLREPGEGPRRRVTFRKRLA